MVLNFTYKRDGSGSVDPQFMDLDPRQNVPEMLQYVPRPGNTALERNIEKSLAVILVQRPFLYQYFVSKMWRFKQCCGSETIYSGSGVEFTSSGSGSRQKFRIHADPDPTYIN